MGVLLLLPSPELSFLSSPLCTRVRSPFERVSVVNSQASPDAGTAVKVPVQCGARTVTGKTSMKAKKSDSYYVALPAGTTHKQVMRAVERAASAAGSYISHVGGYSRKKYPNAVHWHPKLLSVHPSGRTNLQGWCSSHAPRPRSRAQASAPSHSTNGPVGGSLCRTISTNRCRGSAISSMAARR